MVVDDEHDLVNVVEIYLKKWKFGVDSFTNPVDAIARFKNSPFSYLLVITDIRMPQKSGLALAKSILRVKPDAKIIIITAFEITREELESSLPIIQHKDILKKPFDLVQICGLVKK
jgi:two-component system cell cycle sensor histidine kinase/response regulator CckA